ncbi:ankyrin repeat domain-containing protein 26-like isoform X1 [Ictidomys tridecemlineatus]
MSSHMNGSRHLNMDEPQDEINTDNEISNEAALSLEETSEEEETSFDDTEDSQPQVPTRDCTRKDLLHLYNRLEDEIALLRVDIDTVRCQSQDMEKKYLENIEIVKVKSDDLQRAIEVNEETEREITLQRNEQLNNLKAEIAMLSLELENLKQNKARLETELEPYCTRLDLVPSHHYENQIPRRDLEFSIQEIRNEYFSAHAKMDFDICNLKINSVMVSQQLSKNKTKICSLENELCHTTDALKEMTLVLENVQRDLSETKCQVKKIEHMYQNEQSKVNKYTEKQESTEERLSQLQNENTLPQQQLHDLHNNTENKEETVIDVLHRFHDILKVLQDENKKYNLMLKNRIKELINSCNHFEERLQKRYGKEKAEREVAVRQLQQEQADTLKGGSMSESSLEVSSGCRLSLEEETRNLKKELNQNISQIKDEAASSKYLHLDAQYQCFQQQLLSLQSLQNICEKLERNQNKWEQYIVEISSYIENRVEQGQGAWHAGDIKNRVKQDLEEKQKQTQAPAQKNSEQLQQNNYATLSQMELRIQDLESELSKMKSQNYSEIVEEEYEEFYLGEPTIIESLSAEVKNLHRRNERLEELNIRLLEEKHQLQTLRCPLYTRPVPELSCVRNHDRSQRLRRSLSQRENVVVPTRHPQPARKSTEDYLAEMEQAVDKGLTRALEEVTTEFEPGSARSSTPKSNKSSQDLLLEAQQEYAKILKKKYMI